MSLQMKANALVKKQKQKNKQAKAAAASGTNFPNCTHCITALMACASRAFERKQGRLEGKQKHA